MWIVIDKTIVNGIEILLRKRTETEYFYYKSGRGGIRGRTRYSIFIELWPEDQRQRWNIKTKTEAVQYFKSLKKVA